MGTENDNDPIIALFTGFLKKGYTPIPDDLLDWVIPILSKAEQGVLLYICRRTYGFGKRSDKISLGQFCSGVTATSGLALDLGTRLSRQGVLTAIKGLRAIGVLAVKPGGGRSQVSEYAIQFSQSALDRIRTLKASTRKTVNSVDPSKTQPRRRFPRGKVDGKGQLQKDEKVKDAARTGPQKVYSLDSQETAVFQQTVREQETARAKQNSYLTSKKNYQNEDQRLPASNFPAHVPSGLMATNSRYSSSVSCSFSRVRTLAGKCCVLITTNPPWAQSS